MKKILSKTLTYTKPIYEGLTGRVTDIVILLDKVTLKKEIFSMDLFYYRRITKHPCKTWSFALQN